MFYLIVSLQNKKITINKYKKDRKIHYGLFCTQFPSVEPLNR